MNAINRLKSVALAKAFAPFYDPSPDPTEARFIVDSLLGAHHKVDLIPPGNDQYSHLIVVRFHDMELQILLRFDLRLYVLVPYKFAQKLRAFDNSITSENAEEVIGVRSALARAGFQELPLRDLSAQLSPSLVDQGYLDNTYMAYFFESF